MLLMFLISTISFFISIAIMILTSILPKNYFSSSKNSPYECGFDRKGSSRLPFSLWFFFNAVFYKIFDVAITLLLFTAPAINLSNAFSWLSTIICVLMTLLLGLYYEWYKGALQ